jgi:hypothetical protein
LGRSIVIEFRSSDQEVDSQDQSDNFWDLSLARSCFAYRDTSNWSRNNKPSFVHSHSGFDDFDFVCMSPHCIMYNENIVFKKNRRMNILGFTSCE